MQDQNFNSVNIPGNESVSTDDLIFLIGEKEIDLYRKRKAISNLINNNQQIDQLNNIIKQLQEELNNSNYKLQENSVNQEMLDNLKSKLEEKDIIIEKLINSSIFFGMLIFAWVMWANKTDKL